VKGGQAVTAPKGVLSLFPQKMTFLHILNILRFYTKVTILHILHILRFANRPIGRQECLFSLFSAGRYLRAVLGRYLRAVLGV